MGSLPLFGTIGIEYFVILSCFLFVTGLFGIVYNKKSIINILLSIELLLLAANINFVAFSVFLKDYTGQVFSIFILTTAAAEAAIGLALIVIYFRKMGDIYVDSLSEIRN